ncbi:MAG: hypothetical protein MUF04_14575 [Akkermansiaceae bacterium]|nr:hypothetical protein [Akkermansiaceae bacterium]
MLLHFYKMNGAGNDFVVVDNRDGSLTGVLDRDTIAALCDRHRGVGADGLLAVETALEGADFRFRYYNADGGEAEMCGNGARCFGRFAAHLADEPMPQVTFDRGTCAWTPAWWRRAPTCQCAFSIPACPTRWFGCQVRVSWRSGMW